MSRKKIYDKENIVAIRKFFKLTQQKFAERINISRANLAKYETGGANAPFEIMDSIAIQFGFDVNDLYDKPFNEAVGSFEKAPAEAKKYKTSFEDPELNFGANKANKLQLENFVLQINLLKAQLADKEKIIELQNEKIENLTSKLKLEK